MKPVRTRRLKTHPLIRTFRLSVRDQRNQHDHPRSR